MFRARITGCLSWKWFIKVIIGGNRIFVVFMGVMSGKQDGPHSDNTTSKISSLARHPIVRRALCNPLRLSNSVVARSRPGETGTLTAGPKGF